MPCFRHEGGQVSSMGAVRVPKGDGMSSLRKYSLAAGLCICSPSCRSPRSRCTARCVVPNFVAGPGPDAPVILGALLEMIVAGVR
jgi:hypothetical protein